jgi:hypothetical protein
VTAVVCGVSLAAVDVSIIVIDINMSVYLRFTGCISKDSKQCNNICSGY